MQHILVIDNDPAIQKLEAADEMRRIQTLRCVGYHRLHFHTCDRDGGARHMTISIHCRGWQSTSTRLK